VLSARVARTAFRQSFIVIVPIVVVVALVPGQKKRADSIGHARAEPVVHVTHLAGSGKRD
jgi:hypothetical protein